MFEANRIADLLPIGNALKKNKTLKTLNLHGNMDNKEGV